MLVEQMYPRYDSSHSRGGQTSQIQPKGAQMRKSRLSYAFAAFLGLAALASPAYGVEEEQKLKVHCEYCACNGSTGICECRNCTMTPAT